MVIQIYLLFLTLIIMVFKYLRLSCLVLFSFTGGCMDSDHPATTIQTHYQEFPQRISVEGNMFIDESGRTMVFKGLNTSDPERLDDAGQWNRRYFEEMKAWGANVVRFPIHPESWRRRGTEGYLELLDEGIQLASEMEMYVILDWHSIGNLRREIFMKPYYETSWKETREFWKTIAARYKDNKTVAFFELFNEPVANTEFYGRMQWSEWKAMMEQIISEIRQEGAEAIPLVAGFDWAYDLRPVKDAPVDAPGIAYVSHPYPQKRNQPWEQKWTDDWGFVADKYPVILSEIGFSGANDKGAHAPVIGDETYGDAITGYAAKKGISYVVWVFDPDWSPMLFSDWDFTPTRPGQYFKKALQRP